MQRKNSRGSGLIVLIWTSFAAIAIVVVACSWVTLTSVAVQAADPNNILLDFSAKWCGPCQQMSPIVSKLERQGFPIRQVDIDRENDLARRFNVESIPCFVLVANGREVSRITGATDENKLISLMNMLPKQGSGDDLVDKSPRKGPSLTPTSKVSAKTGDDKKPFLKMPSLFAKNQEPKLTPTDTPETIRSQTPGPASKSKESAREALLSSTRIRVKNGTHVHFGSGTLIDSQPGRSVILTCGHILRGLHKDAVIEVDVFQAGQSEPVTLIAKVLQFDLEADVGLLSIPSQQRLPVVALASRGTPEVDDRVFSIGCGGGSRPAVEDHAVTAINSCVGPDNLECTGVPQQGRSGGGLFLGTDLVGVCILADPKFKRGIYTGMKPVAQLLEKAKLGYLVPSSSGNDEMAANDSLAGGPSIGSAVEMNEDTLLSSDESIARIIEASTRDIAGAVPSANAAAASRDYIGAEIVCIVRPKTPGAMSRVVIVNQASTRFVDDLLHESAGTRRATTTAAIENNPPKQQTVKRSATKSNANIAQKEIENEPITAKRSKPNDRPIETSFEPQPSRRDR